MAILNLIPGNVPLSYLGGVTYTTTIQLFQDAAQTTPFDLTPYTVAIYIGSILTLTVGAGLAIPTPTNGTITMTLTAAQTAQGVASAGITQDGYRVQLVDSGGNVSVPLHGTISFSAP